MSFLFLDNQKLKVEYLPHIVLQDLMVDKLVVNAVNKVVSLVGACAKAMTCTAKSRPTTRPIVLKIRPRWKVLGQSHLWWIMNLNFILLKPIVMNDDNEWRQWMTTMNDDNDGESRTLLMGGRTIVSTRPMLATFNRGLFFRLHALQKLSTSMVSQFLKLEDCTILTTLC